MSIQSEITRISGNVSDAFDAVTAKGGTVPTGATSDDLATAINSIQAGGGLPDGILDLTSSVTEVTGYTISLNSSAAAVRTTTGGSEIIYSVSVLPGKNVSNSGYVIISFDYQYGKSNQINLVEAMNSVTNTSPTIRRGSFNAEAPFGTGHSANTYYYTHWMGQDAGYIWFQQKDYNALSNLKVYWVFEGYSPSLYTAAKVFTANTSTTQIIQCPSGYEFLKEVQLNVNVNQFGNIYENSIYLSNYITAGSHSYTVTQANSARPFMLFFNGGRSNSGNYARIRSTVLLYDGQGNFSVSYNFGSTDSYQTTIDVTKCSISGSNVTIYFNNAFYPGGLTPSTSNPARVQYLVFR